MKLVRNLGVLTALTLYVFSLSLPAFECGHQTSLSGFGVLTSGYLGFMAFDFRWLGNATFAAMVFYLAWYPGRRAFPDSPSYLFLPATTLVFCMWAVAAPAHGCWGGESPKGSIDLSTGGQLWVAALVLASVLFVVALVWDSNGRATDG
jgi:hypothetical protein